MVALNVKVGAGWAGQSLEFVFFRAAAQLGSATAATESTVANVPVYSASPDMSSFGAGTVDIVLRQNATPYDMAWSGSIRIDASGDEVEQDTSSIPASVLAAGDVDGYTLEEALRILLAVNAGTLSGAATTTNTIRAADDSKARVTATVDASGNRTSITLDAS